MIGGWWFGRLQNLKWVPRSNSFFFISFSRFGSSCWKVSIGTRNRLAFLEDQTMQATEKLRLPGKLSIHAPGLPEKELFLHSAVNRVWGVTFWSCKLWTRHGMEQSACMLEHIILTTLKKIFPTYGELQLIELGQTMVVNARSLQRLVFGRTKWFTTPTVFTSRSLLLTSYFLNPFLCYFIDISISPQTTRHL